MHAKTTRTLRTVYADKSLRQISWKHSNKTYSKLITNFNHCNAKVMSTLVGSSTN